MTQPQDFTDVTPVDGTVRPNVRFMFSHPAHLLALGFGSGLSPKAPGTVGTLWAWLAFVILGHGMADWQWVLVITGSTLAGWWACTVTAKHMGIADSSHMVADEIVAFWLVLWLINPTTWVWQTVAFGVFRFFDAVKFGPTAWADQHFKGFGPRGGWGVMVDDLIAAILTLVVMALLMRWWA